MHAKENAEALVTHFKTRDPHKLANAIGCKIVYKEFSDLNGTLLSINGAPIIMVSNKLPMHQEKYVIAHELGHLIGKHYENAFQLMKENKPRVRKFENEADAIAVCIIISDESLIEYKELTIQELASIFGLDQKLIELRLKFFDKSLYDNIAYM